MLITLITSSVNLIQPQSLWELDFLASTVKTVLIKKTPYYAHFVKSPWFGILNPLMSVLNSLKIFFKLGGILVYVLGTEKHNPIASLSLIYGS